MGREERQPRGEADLDAARAHRRQDRRAHRSHSRCGAEA
jgi:hypothetical protein